MHHPRHFKFENLTCTYDESDWNDLIYKFQLPRDGPSSDAFWCLMSFLVLFLLILLLAICMMLDKDFWLRRRRQEKWQTILPLSDPEHKLQTAAAIRNWHSRARSEDSLVYWQYPGDWNLRRDRSKRKLPEKTAETTSEKAAKREDITEEKQSLVLIDFGHDSNGIARSTASLPPTPREFFGSTRLPSTVKCKDCSSRTDVRYGKQFEVDLQLHDMLGERAVMEMRLEHGSNWWSTRLSVPPELKVGDLLNGSGNKVAKVAAEKDEEDNAEKDAGKGA